MSDPYLGEIRLFAGNFAPEHWAFCDGRLMSIAENDALFVLIGTIYGGDGQTTFALPDLRGRLPVGQGTGAGLTPRSLGEQFGSDSVTLSVQQLPTHGHGFVATTAEGKSPGPEGNLFADAGEDVIYAPPGDTPPYATMNQQTVRNSGGNRPHDNHMRSVGMNYIISLAGIFPTGS